MTKTTDSKAAKIDNGVNVDALLGAREALEQAPEAAQFKWRATLRMGERNAQPLGRSATSSAWAPSNPATKPSAWKLTIRRSSRPRTMRQLRWSLSCPGWRAASPPVLPQSPRRRGIQLHSVKATLEGDMDIQGILGIDDDVRNGFGAIRVHFDISADASDDDIKALVAQSQKRSAVFDIVTNPTNVFVTVN